MDIEALFGLAIFGAGIMLPIIFTIFLVGRQSARGLRVLRDELVQSGSIIPAPIDRVDA